MSYQEDMLAMTTEHISRAEVLIARQCGLIKRLEHKGWSKALAEQLLMGMLVSHANMVDRKKTLLAGSTRQPTASIVGRR
jgi:hypothetical protein